MVQKREMGKDIPNRGKSVRKGKELGKGLACLELGWGHLEQVEGEVRNLVFK